MSFFDDMREKAEDIAGEHGDKIEGGLDKLGDLIDEKTDHQHSEHIDTGIEKAKGVLEDLEQADRAPEGDTGNAG